MRKGLRRAGLAFFLMLWAMGPALAREYKIGYVDVRKVVQESDRAAEARQGLQEEVQTRQQELRDKQQRIERLRGELQEQGSLMSEEQRRKKKRKLQEAMRELRRSQKAAQEDLDAEKNQVLQDLYEQVSEIIDRLGETEEFDLILTGPAAMYVNDRVDLTDQVLEELNQESTP